MGLLWSRPHGFLKNTLRRVGSLDSRTETPANGMIIGKLGRSVQFFVKEKRLLNEAKIIKRPEQLPTSRPVYGESILFKSGVFKMYKLMKIWENTMRRMVRPPGENHEFGQEKGAEALGEKSSHQA